MTPEGNKKIKKKKDNEEKDNKNPPPAFIFSLQSQTFQEDLMAAYRFTVPWARGARGS